MAKNNNKVEAPENDKIIQLTKRGKNALGIYQDHVAKAIIFSDEPSIGIMTYDNELKELVKREEEAKKAQERDFSVAEQLQTATVAAENGPVPEDTVDLAEALKEANEIIAAAERASALEEAKAKPKPVIAEAPVVEVSPFEGYVFDENGTVIADNVATLAEQNKPTDIEIEPVIIVEPTVDELIDLLTESALNAELFHVADIAELTSKFDKAVFESNVSYVIKRDGDLNLANIFYNNPKLLVDPELTGKLEVLYNNGFTVDEIVMESKMLDESFEVLSKKTPSLQPITSKENHFEPNLDVLKSKVELTEDHIEKYRPLLSIIEPSKFAAVIESLGAKVLTEHGTFNYIAFMAMTKQMENELVVEEKNEMGMGKAA